MDHLVYIVILNYNGWRDTLECLESVFCLSYSNFRVIVCDNNSQDSSEEKIIAWADGHLAAPTSAPHLAYLTTPPVPKPVRYKLYSRQQAECGGSPDDDRVQLIIIQTGANLGYAGGNNVGLRYALARGDFAYVWLLNNDTVVRPDTLTHLVKCMQVQTKAGICGSTLLYYQEPDMVQALGGATYNKWLGIPKHIGIGTRYSNTKVSEEIVSKMDYIVGASMLVSREFLQEVGLLCEDYFLYFEELDWAYRAKGRYTLAYAPDSIVYHKEGNSIGGGKDVKAKSLTADIYGIRNRVLITRKFFPYCLPTVYMGMLVTFFNRLRRGQRERLLPILKGLFELY